MEGLRKHTDNSVMIVFRPRL